jgi:uncharacterized protein YcnI
MRDTRHPKSDIKKDHAMKPHLPLAAAFALALTPYNAFAHPGLQPREAKVGASHRIVISIPHGCDGSATIRMRVVIPEGVIGVKPMLRPGWSITTVRGPYARSYPHYHGQTLTGGVKEVIWSGRLPDDLFDDFVFSAFLSDTLPAGQKLYFPVTQECEKGEKHWSEMPAPGQDAHALTSPAPGVTLLPAAQKAAAARATNAGQLVIEGAWARATPVGAKVGGAYLKVTNTGSTPDRLVGASFAVAEGAEVHEMATADGIMKMRELPNGLEIPPGQSVELKPGSYHLMLTGLREPLREGGVLKGKLAFEKAGTVDVELTIGAMGAKTQGHGPHVHH